jgi:TonB family protein
MSMSINLAKFAVGLGLVACGAGAVVPRSISAQEEATARKITARVQPVYPPIAKRAHMAGTVKFVLIVTPEGTVKTVRTLGGNPLLVIAAEEAVKRWKFEPSRKESTEAVAVTFQNPE